MIKLLLILCLLSSAALAQTCGVETVELPPVGMVSAKHVCACSGNAFNCGWTWVAGPPPQYSVPVPAAAPPPPAPAFVPPPPPNLTVPAPDYQAIMAWKLAREQRQYQEDLTRQQLGLPTRGEIKEMQREEKLKRAAAKREERWKKKLAKEEKKQEKEQPADQ